MRWPTPNLPEKELSGGWRLQIANYGRQHGTLEADVGLVKGEVMAYKHIALLDPEEQRSWAETLSGPGRPTADALLKALRETIPAVLEALRRSTLGLYLVKAVPEESSPARFRLTDWGNAQRLVARHGQDVRWCPEWKSWLVWDSRRWVRQPGSEVVEGLAKNTVDAMYAEADRLKSAFARMLLKDHAERSESNSRLRAMVSLIKSEPGVLVSPDELDTDPWLLNVDNGTLDLHTGELREHRREDLITKLAPVTYDPDAEAPLWTAFLDRIMDGPRMRPSTTADRA